MYSESLFQEFLIERTKMSAKKKRINTDRAVKALRKKLEIFYHEGYDCDAIIEKSMDKVWIDIFRLADVEPKTRHLRPVGAVKDLLTDIDVSLPKPTESKQQEADRKRKAGRDALEARRALGLEK